MLALSTPASVSPEDFRYVNLAAELQQDALKCFMEGNTTSGSTIAANLGMTISEPRLLPVIFLNVENAIEAAIEGNVDVVVA